MTFLSQRAALAGLLVLLAASCQPYNDGVVTVGDERGTPEYAPDDPCKGVVPELCPR